LNTARFQVWILVIGCIIGLAKFMAYFITHANAIFSDALESVVNIIVGAFALYSIYLSALPRDENHPYGHGKIEFISSSIEGGLILISGIAILIKAIHGFFNPTYIHSLDIGLIIVTIAGLLNYILGVLTLAKAKSINSPALHASAIHLKTDGYTSVGLIFGLIVLNYTQVNWIDQAIAMVFGGLIVFQGVKILRSSVAGIMDETDNLLLSQIIHELNINRKSVWIDIHNMRVIKYGSGIHIDAHLTLPWYFNGREIHQEVKDLNALINRYNGKDVEMFVHTDPCEPWSCSICKVEDCSVRHAPFEKTINWSIENAMKDQKHQI
jgi:cation diffusion facilitator family transporter